MNREIKFRGWFQGINGTEMWVYGYLVKQTNGNWEITNGETSWTVDDVGQFTGLLDKNGKEIYEGDIIISKFTGKAKHEICYGEYAEDYENPDATKVGFYTIEDGIEIQGFGKDINGTTDSYEVVGNVYEQNG